MDLVCHRDPEAFERKFHPVGRQIYRLAIRL